MSKIKHLFTAVLFLLIFSCQKSALNETAEPNKRLGELLLDSEAGQLAVLIKYLKSNNTIEELQEEFNKRADNPVKN